MCLDIGLVFSPVEMFFECLRNYDRDLPGTVKCWHLDVLLFFFVPNFNSLMI